MTGMRNEAERLCLIVNPRSGAGATARRLDALRHAADRHFASWDLWQTEGPHHATELAARAVAEGFSVVAAVGGDGTSSEVVNGLFDGQRSRDPEVVFTVVPAGTGSDLVKTLRIPKDLDEAVRVAATGETRASDVAAYTVARPDAEPTLRLGINVAGFGAQGEVVRRANGSRKRFGGTVTFLDATIRTILTYRPAPVEITWVDAEGSRGAWSGKLANAFLCNGAYCGGGMWIGAGGTMQDGHLDLVVIPELPTLTMLRGVRRLFDGTVDRFRETLRVPVVSLEARAAGDRPVLVDIDGEQPGILPIKVEVLTKSLNVRGLWS